LKEKTKTFKMRKQIQDFSKLAVAAVAVNGYSIGKSKSIVISGVVGISLVWTTLVIMAFCFFSRVATMNGEKFRLSLGFALASCICPIFAVVPICLNVY
jgi:hypothetical protein